MRAGFPAKRPPLLIGYLRPVPQLERHLHFGPVGLDLTVLDLEIEFDNFRQSAGLSSDPAAWATAALAAFSQDSSLVPTGSMTCETLSAVTCLVR